eukprot:CAMPEP_0114295942 /NCGR_PEP_ID=MMETSP0059-20121206/11043_1 /TAXON_ID=36894 /ORGANISM="Pyramimonas parkeae, Strain CCMP726" /LENGTH=86 /DNA_ID=CAMNT_0001418049 /DNA_START=609 /DNA_END=865 /DNA_ORIENTATION=-
MSTHCIFARSLPVRLVTNNDLTYEVLLFAIPVEELLGAAVGDIEGGALVGGEVGQSEPRSVPPNAAGHRPEYAVGVTPAGMSPHKP